MSCEDRWNWPSWHGRRGSGSRSSAVIWSSACSRRTLSRPRPRAMTPAARHGSRRRSGCAATLGSTSPAPCSSVSYLTGSVSWKLDDSHHCPNCGRQTSSRLTSRWTASALEQLLRLARQDPSESDCFGVRPRAGSRRTRPFRARGSAAHPGSAGWHAPPPRRPASRTPVRSPRHGSSGPPPPSPGP